MKQIFFMTLAIFSFMGAAFAQEPPEGDTKQQEKLKSLYVAFITQKLDLTATEAQEFWPLHNEFDKEVKGVDPNLPELDREQKVLDIKRRFEPRFLKVLRDNKRVNRLFILHSEWRRKLIDRMKNRPNPQRPRPGIRRG